MKHKIHVVPHSHWDREWYFTTARSKIYLMKDLKEVLDTLEHDPEFKYFTLDAQGSLLDDYIKWLPQDAERITKLVKEKRLIIGPWYTQSDQMVISGESIVRNLYYGIKRCEEFGGYMNVGYVPDSFGQAGNMPQIYRAFGMEDTLFWRGVSDDMVKETDFNWRGDDGSVVFAAQIPFGYDIGGKIPEESKENDEFWEKVCLKKAGKGSSTRHIYFPNGFDQAPVRTNLPELVRQRNEKDPENEYVISCIEDYIREVKQEAPVLEEVQGELVIAKHMRIHKSIFSSRSDLKVLNTQVQNYVVNVMEPLLVLSYKMGNDYPHEVIKEIWKLLFENAAHDSIGSCISDTANEDVYFRYKQARDLAVNLAELHSRLIAVSVKKNADMTFTVINTLPAQREDTVLVKTYIPGGSFAILGENGTKIGYTVLESRDLTDYVLAQTIKLDPSKNFYAPAQVLEAVLAIKTEDVPALGYVQYSLDGNGNSAVPMEETEKLENEFYVITAAKTGALTILDKESGILYENQAVLVENGDDGDSFNYSPPIKDLEIYSTGSPFSCKLSQSNVYGKAELTFDMTVPKDLEERALGKASEHMETVLTAGLRKGSKVIDFCVRVKNRGLSHRLCVLFDSRITSKFHFADEQFGSVMRPNFYEKEMRLYEEAIMDQEVYTQSGASKDKGRFRTAWQEPPISIEPTQAYVSLTDQKSGIALFPQGVREYEVIENRKIRLTLFRTYGFMGKENLLYRPGRASGEKIIETKAAQLLKEMEFAFGFTSYHSGLNEAHIDTLAKRYHTPLEVYTYAEFLNGRIIFSQQESEGMNSARHSLFHTENRLVISAIKKAEEEEGLIIRLYNGKDHQNVGDALTFHYDIKEAYYTDLKELKTERIPIEGRMVRIKELSHCKFVTIYVK